ncbi:MAG: hypothetical protein IJ869_06035 [Clostridiales bacterium]|jgi:hypothetical protein|nr:hypothetical protein [Clostridiales bacterium]
MLTAIFVVALIYTFIRMLICTFKLAWGFAKIVAFVVLLPLMIVGLALSGMFMLALGLVLVSALFATVLSFF